MTVLIHVRSLFTQSVDYSVFWIYLDEGYRLYPSLRLLRGEKLFSDFFTAYPPLSYYLHTLAYVLFGVKVSSVRIVLIVSQLVTTMSTYAVARYLMNRWFALLAALFTIAFGIIQLNMGYSGWYVVPCMLITILFMFRWITSDCVNRYALFNAGLFTGVAIGIKLRDGAWICVGCFIAIQIIHILREFSPGRRKPKPFNPLYASYLLLPIVVLLMLRGNQIFFGHLLLFLLPSVLVCLSILIRQLFFTIEIRQHTYRLITDLLLFVSGAAVTIIPWVLYYLFLLGPEIFWQKMIILPMALKARLGAWQLSLFPMGWAIATAVAATVLMILSLVGSARWRNRFSLIFVLSMLFLQIFLWVGPSPWTDKFGKAGLFVLLPMISGMSGLYFIIQWRRADIRVQAVITLGVMNTVAIMSLSPWIDFYHWLWACIPALILSVFGASRFYARLRDQGYKLHWIVVATSCMALLYCMKPVAEGIRGTMPMVSLQNSSSGDISMSLDSAYQIQEIIDFVNQSIPEDGYILEIPGSLYAFLTGRRQAASLDYFFLLDGTMWDDENTR